MGRRHPRASGTALPATHLLPTHERGEFFIADTGAPIWSARAVVFTDAAYIEAA